jgi:hypothetical protein
MSDAVIREFDQKEGRIDWHIFNIPQTIYREGNGNRLRTAFVKKPESKTPLKTYRAREETGNSNQPDDERVHFLEERLIS